MTANVKMGPVRQPVVEHWSVTELAKIMKPNQDQPPVMPVRQPIEVEDPLAM